MLKYLNSIAKQANSEYIFPMIDKGQHLFGTSGIRGVVNQDLTPELCHQAALALGTVLPPRATVCVATDTRISREIIKKAITSGLLSAGINVVDMGILPTPALALLTREWNFATGIMVTASHNPPEFNGIKLFNNNAMGYSQSQEAEIEKIYFTKSFRNSERQGTIKSARGMKERYLQFLKEKLPGINFKQQLKIVVDPGNGAASGFASSIFSQMGLDVIPINDAPDGHFPGRNPEPNEDSLQKTIAFLRQQNADIAICFDGDADRVVFCDREGFLGFNEMIAFVSRLAIEKTGRKKVATTVETGKLLDLALSDLGVEVVRGKVGDVPVAHLAQELNAAIGVEEVGVYIFPEAGYYPDSMFASLVLLSQVEDVKEIREFFRNIPRLFFEKNKVFCSNELKKTVMAQVNDFLATPNMSEKLFEINATDGLRLEFDNSWMLVRASGTEPVIRVIAEATSKDKVDALVRRGTELVQGIVERN